MPAGQPILYTIYKHSSRSENVKFNKITMTKTTAIIIKWTKNLLPTSYGQNKRNTNILCVCVCAGVGGGGGRSLGKGRKGEVERERERGGRWTVEVFCFQQTSSQDKGVQACD